MPCLPKLEPASTVLPGRRATAGGLSGRVLLTLHPGSPDSPRSPISVRDSGEGEKDNLRCRAVPTRERRQVVLSPGPARDRGRRPAG